MTNYIEVSTSVMTGTTVSYFICSQLVCLYEHWLLWFSDQGCWWIRIEIKSNTIGRDKGYEVTELSIMVKNDIILSNK